MTNTYRIAVLPGDGIGLEVMRELGQAVIESLLTTSPTASTLLGNPS